MVPLGVVVGVPVGVADGEFVGVSVRMGEIVPVGVIVGVPVDVCDGVAEKVLVGVFEAMAEGVTVGVLVEVEVIAGVVVNVSAAMGPVTPLFQVPQPAVMKMTGLTDKNNVIRNFLFTIKNFFVLENMISLFFRKLMVRRVAAP